MIQTQQVTVQPQAAPWELLLMGLPYLLGPLMVLMMLLMMMKGMAGAFKAS